MFCNRKLIFKYLLQKQIIFQRLLFYSQSNLLCPHSCWNDRKFKFVIKQRIFQCPTKKYFFKGNKNTFKTFFFYSWQSQVRQRALRENKFNWQAANFWATFFLFFCLSSFFLFSVFLYFCFVSKFILPWSQNGPVTSDLWPGMWCCSSTSLISFWHSLFFFLSFFLTFLTPVFFLSFFFFLTFFICLVVLLCFYSSLSCLIRLLFFFLHLSRYFCFYFFNCSIHQQTLSFTFKSSFLPMMLRSQFRLFVCFFSFCKTHHMIDCSVNLVVNKISTTTANIFQLIHFN